MVIVRSDEEISAFHNVCQHRGHRLVGKARGCAKRLVCPYHHWSYDLEGGLRHVPDVESFGGEFDLARHGLQRLATKTVGDQIWVDLGGA